MSKKMVNPEAFYAPVQFRAIWGAKVLMERALRRRSTALILAAI
jgi:hypothetical protein